MMNLIATTESPVAPPKNDWTMIWVTSIVLLVAFFFMEHRNGEVSQLDGFQVTADELATSAAEGDIGHRLAIPAVGLYGALLLLRRRGPAMGFDSALGWVLLLNLIWCSVSIVWSEEKSLTFRHFTAFLLCGTGALGIARQLSMRELCIVALMVTTPLILNGVRTELVLHTFRPWASDYRFAGTLHPNVQAPYCVVMALAAGVLAQRARSYRLTLWLLCVLGVFFLLITKSRTAAGSLAAAIMLFTLANLSVPKRVLAVAGIISVVTSLYLANVILNLDIAQQFTKTALIGRQEESESLTGRVPLWRATIPYLEDHMLLGYGYETFWSPKRIETFSRTQGWSVPNAHCAYLDTLLNIGLVGLGLSLSMIFLSVKASWRQYMVHRDYGCGFVCILIMARSFNAILESALAVPTSFPAFTMIVGLAYLAFRILPKTKPAARDMIAEEQMVGVAL